jgi:hypothetical protein
MAHATERECVPSVRLITDEPTKSPLTIELARRGLLTGSTTSCGLIIAQVERDGRFFLVQLADGFGRTGQRRVASSRTAASLIESWVRSDLSAPILQGALSDQTPKMRTPIVPERNEADDEQRASMEVAADGRPIPRFSIVASAEGLVDNKGGFWVGAEVGAWIQVGSLYLGPTARFLTLSRTDNQLDFVPDGKVFEAKLDAELPLHLGPVMVRPGVGLGGASSSMHWEHRRHGPAQSGALQESSPAEGMFDHESKSIAVAPRADLHVLLTVPVSDSFGLAVRLSADFAPFAGPQLVEQNGYERPAEPWFMTGLGVGVSWGGP